MRGCTNQCLIALRATPKGQSKPLCGRAQRDRALVSVHLTRCLRVLRDAAAGGRAQRERALVRATFDFVCTVKDCEPSLGGHEIILAPCYPARVPCTRLPFVLCSTCERSEHLNYIRKLSKDPSYV